MFLNYFISILYNLNDAIVMFQRDAPDIILTLHVTHEANFEVHCPHGVTWDSLSSLNTSVR